MGSDEVYKAFFDQVTVTAESDEAFNRLLPSVASGSAQQLIEEVRWSCKQMHTTQQTHGNTSSIRPHTDTPTTDMMMELAPCSLIPSCCMKPSTPLSV